MVKVYSILTVLFLFVAFGNVRAQRIVDVPPGIGTLNDSIVADTLADGSRVDTNTIYRLQRGDQALYLLTGSIENRFPLTIVAEDGDGARPFLQPKIGDGGSSSRPFRPRADITLQGLHVTNRDNDDGLNKNMIRCSADDIKIVVEDCWLDQDAQACFRLDNPGMKLYITNTVMSNIGSPADASNGRGVDDRGNNIDTVIIEKCTFYNLTSRIVRDDGGWIKYAKFNKNTVVNVGQHGIWFGETGTLEVKDNIFVNQPFLPIDLGNREGAVVVDSIGSELTGMGITQSVIISHNNFALDTSLIADYLNDTIIVAPLFDSTTLTFVEESGLSGTFLFEPLTFTNEPPDPTDFISHRLDPDKNPGDASFWEIPDVPDGQFYHLDVPYDFGYVSTPVATGSSTEDQLGDPRWTGVVSNIDYSYADNLYKLKAYPNPFQSSTNFEFTLNEKANVSIEIFNYIGQKIATLVDKEMIRGEHKVTWNGISDGGTKLYNGVYFVKLRVDAKEVAINKIIIER